MLIDKSVRGWLASRSGSFEGQAVGYPSLKRLTWPSMAAAILTIGFKAIAYQLTASVGLLSDALESFVNLAGALMALAMLTIAARPADEGHLRRPLLISPNWRRQTPPSRSIRLGGICFRMIV